ncbi:type II secretion system GspH family protein [Burkholderiaceae bacterium DAT-1]|nr:type II secretion system GspH family protein [Burkholderiaceae bacterium DAT-1]
MRRELPSMLQHGGFTLVELIAVIVVTGIMASAVVMFLVPAIESYVDARRRSQLTDLASVAIGRVSRDVRVAVPNSIRISGSNCVQMVPTIAGGRYRVAPDTLWDALHATQASAPLEGSQPISAIDVLSPLSMQPKSGDWLVINNQNGDDVYAGTNRVAIASVGAAPSTSLGVVRLTFASATQFPASDISGRFSIVADAEQSVVFQCVAPGTDMQGNGTGTLYRQIAPFSAAASGCPNPGGGAILASRVSACEFVYSPNQGATQQNGFLWIRLALQERGETVTLASGVHVDNVP